MCNLALVVNRGDTFPKLDVKPKKENSSCSLELIVEQLSEVPAACTKR